MSANPTFFARGRGTGRGLKLEPEETGGACRGRPKRRSKWSLRPLKQTSQGSKTCCDDSKISCECSCSQPGKLVRSSRLHHFWFQGREPPILATANNSGKLRLKRKNK